MNCSTKIHVYQTEITTDIPGTGKQTIETKVIVQSGQTRAREEGSREKYFFSKNAYCGHIENSWLLVKNWQYFLPLHAYGGYTFSAGVNPPVGIGVLNNSIVPTRTERVFLSVKFPHIKIMVGWIRLPQGRPVSMEAGYANLVQLTTSTRLASLGGDSVHSIEVIAMITIPAQTHPKFTWLFLAIPKGHSCTPIVLCTQASTEDAARETLPGWDLTFAAKIRTDYPLLATWRAPDSSTLWSLTGGDNFGAQVTATPPPLPRPGDRYIDRHSGMLLIVQELEEDRVISSYEQYPLASHSHSLDGFYRGYELVEVCHA